MARLLVVNGDDFGLTPGVNAGILDAHRKGVLSSASVLAAGPALAAALEQVRRTPTLGIGCHLALVDGQPVLPPSRVPTLVGEDGRFRPTWRALIGDCFRRRVALDEVERELAAQIDRLRSEGVRVTHLDSHKHVHTYPPLFEIVARLATRFEIRVVRVPLELPAVRLVAGNFLDRVARRQAIENVALAPWARRARRLLARHGLPPPPHFFGRVHTGLLTEAVLQKIMAPLPEGVSELMTHPGYADEHLARLRTRLRAARAAEAALLCAPATREILARAGVTIVRHDLVPYDFRERIDHESEHASPNCFAAAPVGRHPAL